MNKVLTAALAAVIATTSLGVASAAEAQSRGHHEQRQDRRDDHRDDRRDRRDDRREYRQDRREDRQEYRQQQRAYARWQQAQRRYEAQAYRAPRGYSQRDWAYGQRMPVHYRTSQYVISDYGRYGLQQPGYGYQYIRTGNDVALTSSNTGMITAIIAGLFR